MKLTTGAGCEPEPAGGLLARARLGVLLTRKLRSETSMLAFEGVFDLCSQMARWTQHTGLTCAIVLRPRHPRRERAMPLVLVSVARREWSGVERLVVGLNRERHEKAPEHVPQKDNALER